MSEKIKIEIISDVVCPWCIIGYKRLEKAILEMGIKEKVEIEWQPFELNPNMSSEGENILKHMAHKYSMSADQVRNYQVDRAKNGMELGFMFDNFEKMKIVNTRDAHILLEYAKKSGRQTELAMRLFAAHFGERKDVSNREVLAQEIKNIGLDVDEAMQQLDSEAREDIQKKEAYWLNLGVSAVPTIVFNDSMTMNGAYPIDTYKQVLTELIEQKGEQDEKTNS